MVLCDDFHGEVVFEHGDALFAAHGLDEPALDFKTRVVGVVENAELRVPALAVQVIGAVFLLVEVHAPLDEPLDAGRSLLHHLAHRGGVADVVAGHHGVVDMFLEIVHLQVGHTGHTALGLGGVGLVHCGLAHQSHLALAALRHLQSIAHSGHAGTYYQKVKFANHGVWKLIYGYKFTIFPQTEPILSARKRSWSALNPI